LKKKRNFLKKNLKNFVFNATKEEE